AQPQVDVHGDVLPQGAVARLGSPRLRHRGAPSSVVFSPDGRWLVSSGQGGIVSVWDTKSGEETRQFRTSSPLVPLAFFSPDGTILATVEHAAVRLWNFGTGADLRLCKAEGWVEALAFSADGKHLIGVDAKRTIRTWDVATGAEARQAVSPGIGPYLA